MPALSIGCSATFSSCRLFSNFQLVDQLSVHRATFKLFSWDSIPPTSVEFIAIRYGK